MPTRTSLSPFLNEDTKEEADSSLMHNSTLSSATSLWDHMRSERAGAASHCEFGVQQSQTQKTNAPPPLPEKRQSLVSLEFNRLTF